VFVFAPNFGPVSIENFSPATDTIQFSKTVFANIQALLAATHDNASGNAVITDAAHDTITLKQVTTAQLLAHQSDFHFI
jgi:serralysin